jgi:hypothetical protein
MAKKTRTPDPPRKVQAPKVRARQAAPSSSGGGVAMPSTNVLIGVGLAALVALAILLIVMFSGGGSGAADVTAADVAKARTAVEAAGGTLVPRPAEAAGGHMSDPNQRVRYATFPASNGTHNPTTSIWGDYRVSVDPRQAVHNLEHGGVVIHYGPQVPQAEIDKLRDFYNNDPNGLIVAPLPSNKDKITLSAWTVPDNLVGSTNRGRGWLARCSHFDEGAFSAFVKEHRYKGPERLDPAGLTPGS